jgi:hypothetical protein
MAHAGPSFPISTQSYVMILLQCFQERQRWPTTQLQEDHIMANSGKPAGGGAMPGAGSAPTGKPAAKKGWHTAGRAKGTKAGGKKAGGKKSA